jgi:hypothetical protein
MSRTLSLNASTTGTTDGSGNGTLSVGPAAPGTIWYPVTTTIYMSGTYPSVTGSNTPICSIYVGGTASWNLVDATYTVLGAASSVITGQVLYPGQNIYAVWQYGNEDATITLNISGTRKVP